MSLKLAWRGRTEVLAEHAVTYTCPATDAMVTVSVTNIHVEGGCCGNHGEDEYCYCPYPEAIAEWDDCPSCGGSHKTRMGS